MRYIFLFHGDNSFQGGLFLFFFYFGVELNLELIEARRKAHNKPLILFKALTMPGNV